MAAINRTAFVRTCEPSCATMGHWLGTGRGAWLRRPCVNAHVSAGENVTAWVTCHDGTVISPSGALNGSWHRATVLRDPGACRAGSISHMPANQHRYHLVSRWTVDALADAVYAATYEVVRYPAWWPEVKEVRKRDVVTNRAALNRLAPLARRAYAANHMLMMAHGQAGLRTFLSRYALARYSSVPGETQLPR